MRETYYFVDPCLGKGCKLYASLGHACAGSIQSRAICEPSLDPYAKPGDLVGHMTIWVCDTSEADLSKGNAGPVVKELENF